MKIFILMSLSGLLSVVAQAKLNVVTTTPDLAAIAHEVGGERVTVVALARPMEDPHFVAAKPSFVVKLNRADVLIEGGAELELGWLSALVDQTRNPRIRPGAAGRVAVARAVRLLEVPTTLDRSRGDIHALGNPHFMTDPLNGRAAARLIAEAFCQIDPAAGEAYRAALAQFESRLETKLADWEKRLGPFRGARVAAYHNTWPYFAGRFGLRSDLFLEPKPGIPPTPASLAGVIAQMKADKVRAIIVEPYQNRRTAEKVATETGAVVLDFTQYPGGVKGTDKGYIELIDHLVGTLAAALEKGRP